MYGNQYGYPPQGYQYQPAYTQQPAYNPAAQPAYNPSAPPSYAPAPYSTEPPGVNRV